ncbi:hypothetical protein C6A36_01365 [Desulfobacteraceae bacterium SEEP-SAG10]|nr:hypothetical protein C6A36_01365 [Desulfobacteraceae bacterium SEEP-SAG10]
MKIFIGILYSLSLALAVFFWFMIIEYKRYYTQFDVIVTTGPVLILTLIILLNKYRTNLGLTGRSGKLLIAGSISWIISMVVLYLINKRIFHRDIDTLLKCALTPPIAVSIIVPLITWALKKPSDPERNEK